MSAHPRLAFSLASLGALWLAALVPATFLAPAYSGSECTAGPRSAAVCTSSTATSFAVNGWLVVWYALGLALAGVAVFALLRRFCSTGSRLAVCLAEVTVALTLAFALVAAASIGFFVLPGALLLLVATAVTPRAAHGH